MPMRAKLLLAAGVLLWNSVSLADVPRLDPEQMHRLALSCAPQVQPSTMAAIANVESARNPFAIGVVGARLARQPSNLAEAVATARSLRRSGYNFSMGLVQVNLHNLAKYNDSISSIFSPCRNLRAGAAILSDCFERASRRLRDRQLALRAALSCYYSGALSSGRARGYIERVAQAARAGDAQAIPVVPAIRELGRARPASPARGRHAWVIVTRQASDTAVSLPATETTPKPAAVAVGRSLLGGAPRSSVARPTISAQRPSGSATAAHSELRRQSAVPAPSRADDGDDQPSYVEIVK